MHSKQSFFPGVVRVLKKASKYLLTSSISAPVHGLRPKKESKTKNFKESIFFPYSLIKFIEGNLYINLYFI
jgi:hypothetical protein